MYQNSSIQIYNKIINDYFIIPKKIKIVAVNGDYFDIDNEIPWSRNVLKVNPDLVIFPGILIQSNIIINNINYSKVRWFVDDMTTDVKTEHLTVIRNDFNMIRGIIYKNSAMYNKVKNCKNRIDSGKMSKRENRLSGNIIQQEDIFKN
jgi:hypothetical protein